MRALIFILLVACSSAPPSRKTEILVAGDSREMPRTQDVVVMNLQAWDVSGRLVETYTTNEAFALDAGMPGMIDNILAMRKGEKRRFWLTEAQQGEYKLAAGSIVCELELVDIVRR
jgi:hypothetical protein